MGRRHPPPAVLFPGIPDPLCCLHRSLLTAVELRGAWVSHLERDRQWDRGNLVKEMPIWGRDWLLIPSRWGWSQRLQPDQRRGHVWWQWRAVGGPEPWVFANTSWAPSAGFPPSVPHRPQLAERVGVGSRTWPRSAGRAGFPDGRGGRVASAAAARLRQGGRDIVWPRPHGSPLVPRRGGGSSEMLHLSFVLAWFSREKS